MTFLEKTLWIIIFIIVCIIIGSFSGASGGAYGHSPQHIGWMYERSNMPYEYLLRIYNAANMTKHPELILAIIKVESNFNPTIKSNKGAYGLMQIRHNVWLSELKEKKILHDKRELFLIETNIAAGNYILNKYIEQSSGNLEMALYKYSGKSQKYVGKVLKSLGSLELYINI